MPESSHKPPSHVLAWDTSGQMVSAALGSGDWLSGGEGLPRWRCVDAPGGAQASATLLPTLQQLLQEAGLVWADLSALVVGQGPGAFTGLRTACSLAQGLALGLGDTPVIMADGLMAMAHAARLQRADWCRPGEIHVALDARMGQWYAASYRFDDDRPCPHQVPAVVQAPSLWEPRRWLEVVGASADKRLAYHLPEAVPWPAAIEAVASAPTAHAMLHLAPAQWRASQGVNAAQVRPLYVRDRVAQTMAERGVAP
ncbi:MAG: tRNA (adenosine(37)-N6)-threonylcarbamoyltransferase complex dimerization subunit type 1 TsaB [Burkholderiaceae bacterium]